jgi:hypothetical protein
MPLTASATAAPSHNGCSGPHQTCRAVHSVSWRAFSTLVIHLLFQRQLSRLNFSGRMISRIWSLVIYMSRPVMIHTPVFYLKRDISETGLRPQRLALSTGRRWGRFLWRRRHNPISVTLCFKQKLGWWIMFTIVIVVFSCFVLCSFSTKYAQIFQLQSVYTATRVTSLT